MELYSSPSPPLRWSLQVSGQMGSQTGDLRSPIQIPKAGEGTMPTQRSSRRLPHIKGQGVCHGHGVHLRITGFSALFGSKFSMEIWVQPLTFF